MPSTIGRRFYLDGDEPSSGKWKENERTSGQPLCGELQVGDLLCHLVDPNVLRGNRVDWSHARRAITSL